MKQQNKPLLTVETVSEVSEELIDRLRNTAFGTEGKLRYRQKEIEKGLLLLKNLEFIQIQKGERILATAGVQHRPTHGPDSLYIRYLSANNPFKNRTKDKTLSLNKGKGKPAGRLRSRIGELFTGYFERPFHEQERSGCFYAYVESDNVYSYNMCLSFGFEAIRSIQTLLFSRFSPKKSEQVKKVKTEDTGTYLKALRKYYRDHSFYFDEGITDRGKLYCYYKNDQAVAGIRAYPVNWEIVEIPGFTGFLMQRVLPYLPLTRRLFNPRHLEFLAFDSLWVEKGHEEVIPVLMEHLCAAHDRHLGMFWGDVASPSVQSLLGYGKLGLLHRLNDSVTADVMIRPVNMKEEERKRLEQQPVFVSATDMT